MSLRVKNPNMARDMTPEYRAKISHSRRYNHQLRETFLNKWLEDAQAEDDSFD